MKLRRVGAFALLLCCWSGSAMAVPITDSIAAFSTTQGLGGWYYGFNQTTGGGFQPFDTFNSGAARWEASDAQVGANNNNFLSLHATGGHPTGIGPDSQDAIIWVVRRFVSPVSGLVDITFDLHKQNTGNSSGGGITGYIFVDGVEVFSQFINNSDGMGVQQTLTRSVMIGSIIDFAIDPTGITPMAGLDDPRSALADGTHFSSVISPSSGPNIPEPSTLLLFGIGLVGLARRRSKNSL